MEAIFTTSFNKGAQSMLMEFGRTLLTEAASKYGFDSEEAITHFQLNNVSVKRKTAEPKKAKRLVPAFPLPFTGVKVEGWCSGLKAARGLMSQCTNKPTKNGEFCKTCQKQAEKNDHGMPNCGTIDVRLVVPALEYREPKKNKLCLPYANVMEMLNITRQQAEGEAVKFGLTIPEEQFVKREKAPRSRSSTASSTSSNKSKLSPEEIQERKSMKALAVAAKKEATLKKKFEKRISVQRKKFEKLKVGSWNDEFAKLEDFDIEIEYLRVKNSVKEAKKAAKKEAKKEAKKKAAKVAKEIVESTKASELSNLLNELSSTLSDEEDNDDDDELTCDTTSGYEQITHNDKQFLLEISSNEILNMNLKKVGLKMQNGNLNFDANE